MSVDRLLPTEEAAELVGLVREIALDELAPRAAAAEAAGEFPRDTLRMLGETGVLGLPYPEEYGGSGQPYEVYLQVVEELAAAWLTVGLAVSVHVMSSYPLSAFGTPAQRAAYLPDMVGGQRLGAYALSEAAAGSDIAGMTSRAKPAAEGYDLSGAKAWVSHGGVADFYTTFVRTGEGTGSTAISCFHVPAGLPGLSFGAPEHKMGLTASPTTALYLDAVHVGDDQLIGAEGQGMTIALSALDSGRLGIAACATGLAQAALDLAVGYAKERVQFGRPIAVATSAASSSRTRPPAVAPARACYLLGAGPREAGRPFTRAGGVANMVATDAAMRVTTDAVQVLGGYGYTRDFPAERYLREAKVTQIFEGTNQIQRLVIGRQLLRATP